MVSNHLAGPVFFCALCLWPMAAVDGHAQPLLSPFNERSLDLASDRTSYSFLIGGHLYGAPENSSSVFPSSSLLANLDPINATRADFFMGLGDIIWRSYDVEMPLFKRSFAAKLKMPLFNVVGNHEMVFRRLYERDLGKTYYRFTYGGDGFIVLDTELIPGAVTGMQLGFFKESLKETRRNPRIKNIFVFSHRLIWAVKSERYRVVYQHINNKGSYEENNNFDEEILPALQETAAEKPLYWISGDIGCSWTLPAFWDTDADADITFLGTGMGDTRRDLVVEITRSELGVLSFAVLPMTGGERLPLDHYSLEYWEDYFSRKAAERAAFKAK